MRDALPINSAGVSRLESNRSLVIDCMRFAETRAALLTTGRGVQFVWGADVHFEMYRLAAQAAQRNREPSDHA
jgi:hypothetical protein